LSEEIKAKLRKYVIDKSKPEWKQKRLCWDGVEREIPDTLNGEILLEEHVEDGKVKGWITVHPDALSQILDQAKDPSKRPNITVDLHPKFRGRNLRELSESEFLELTGYSKYLTKWRNEGIPI